MYQRKNPCDICGGWKFKHERSISQRGNQSIHETYEIRCVNCGQLLYGETKPNPNIMLVDAIRSPYDEDE